MEILTAHSAPGELEGFRKTLQKDGRWSFARSMEQVATWMNALEPMAKNTPWEPIILSLCRKMLQAEKHQEPRAGRDLRPKASDIRAWWAHQPSSELPPGKCACGLSPTGSDGYVSDQPDNNLRKAYANGHRLMVEFWRGEGIQIDGNDALVAASEGGLARHRRGFD